MEPTSMITDNIAELLVKIIEFTHTRQKVITHNIRNMHRLGFIPADLAVDEFSDSLNSAINEHARNRCLVLYDSENVKFGAEGNFEVKPTTDHQALNLLKKSPDEYLEIQIGKLLENSINQRVATELLKRKHGMVSIFEHHPNSQEGPIT